MRVAYLLALVPAAFSAPGCLSNSTFLPHSTGKSVPTSAVKSAPPDAVLWDTSTDALQEAFRAFAHSPGTRPNPEFATLSERSGGVRFVTAPDDWKVWRESADDIREIALNSDEFFTYIGIASCPQPPARAESDIQCHKGKGNTNYIETRYVRTRQGWVSVTLTVVAYRGTLADLTDHLRKHYGDYQGVCLQVQRYEPNS